MWKYIFLIFVIQEGYVRYSYDVFSYKYVQRYKNTWDNVITKIK